MKELSEHEKAIRDKDTKELTLSGLKEKIRIIDKEIHAFDVDIFDLAKQTHAVVEKRKRRIYYVSVLRADVNRRINEAFDK